MSNPHKDIPEILNGWVELDPEERTYLADALAEYVLTEYVPVFEALTAVVESRFDELAQFHKMMGQLAVYGVETEVVQLLLDHLNGRAKDIIAIARRRTQDNNNKRKDGDD